MAFLRRSRGDDEPVIEPEPRPTVPEGTAQERRAMVVEAGWGRISIGSALAGLFVAIGMVALLVGATAAIADGAGYDADVATNWNRWGMVAGLGAALLLFVCFLYGSYTA
ncbi:MAG TPA: hypothetical protein VKO35_08655, partial [Acidimicrobiia bacterium]|nr:hypothetical protein [Acidimicrobiia bacterium]